MANPSSKYVLEDTTINGLTCKRTTQAVKDIYPIYSKLDNSIAYTKPKNSKYTKMTNMLLPSNFPQRAYDRTNYYQNHYYSNSAHTNQAWSTLGQIIGNNNGDTSVLLNWAFASDDSEYMFNGSQGTAVIGNGNQKFITDFDVSHVIFSYSITGYTKADFDAWKAGGSTPSAIDITIKQLIDSPDDYYVYRFGAGSSVVWDSDNSQWAVATGVINPTCLIDGGDDIQGIEKPSYVFGYRMGTASGDYNGGISNTNYKLYSASQNYSISDSTQYIRKGGIPYGLVANNSYGIGNAPAEWIMKPQWTAEACEQHLASLSAAETDQSLNPELFYNNGFVQVYGSDLYSASANYSGASQGEFHYTKWNKRISFVTPGSVVCEFLATIGCYFFTESNISASTLNNDGITPDTLSTIPSIGLGVMNADGTTEGRWILGNDIDDYDGINKKGSVVHPNFDPSGGGGGGSQDDDSWHGVNFGGTGAGGGGAFCSVYYMTGAELISLKNWNLTQAPQNFDMLPSIIGLHQLPITLSGIPTTVKFLRSGAVTQDARVVDTGVSAGTGTGQPFSFSLGSVNINRRMQQRGEPYLDYDCTVELFLPFAGTFVLDTQAVMGRTINAEIIIDPVNGTCFSYAWVSQDGQKMPIAYGSGSIAVDLPITSNQHAIARAAMNRIIAESVFNTIKDVGQMIIGGKVKKQGKNAAVVGNRTQGYTSLNVSESVQSQQIGQQMQIQGGTSAVGNIGSGIVSALQINNTNYTAVHGSFGGSYAEWSQPFTAYVRITRPKFKKPSNFNHTQAVPCVETKTLGSCSGLIYCVNPDCGSISCTEAEKIMIADALMGGVYAGGGQ